MGWEYTGRRGRAVALALVLALVAGLGGVPAVAGQQEGTVVGRPALEVVASNNSVAWGETGLALTVVNAGDLDRGGPADLEARVQTARNVRLSVVEDRLDPALADGLDVETGVVPAGNVPPGVSGPYRLDVTVARSLPPGTYELPVRVEYEYTALVEYGPLRDPAYVDREQSRIVRVPLVVERRPELRLEAVPNQTVPQGDRTTFAFRVENVGTQAARDIALALRTDNATVFFRDAANPRGEVAVFLPRLPPGESRVVRASLAADDTTPPGSYLVRGEATYRAPSGATLTQSDLVAGVRVAGSESGNATGNVALASGTLADISGSHSGSPGGSHPVDGDTG